MYGQGPVKPRPKPADPRVAVVVRVALTALPLFTMGLLGWGSMLYLALLRRRPVDWAMVALSAVMSVLGVVFAGTAADENDQRSSLGVLLILLSMFGGAVYFLASDIVRYRAASRPWLGAAGPAGYGGVHPYSTGFAAGPVPGLPQQGQPGAGPYPGPLAPPGPLAHIPVSHGGPTPPPTRPVTPPPPVRAPGSTSAPRLDQVRAELDELSDFLRKEHGESGLPREDRGDGGVR